MTIDEAVFDMDLLDYDFYLFNDLASGQDAVVRRTADDSAGAVQSLHPVSIERPVFTTPVTVSAAAPATLTIRRSTGVARARRRADGLLRRIPDRARLRPVSPIRRPLRHDHTHHLTSG